MEKKMGNYPTLQLDTNKGKGMTFVSFIQYIKKRKFALYYMCHAQQSSINDEKTRRYYAWTEMTAASY